ncbi:MAG: hypothetical protein ACYDBZ_12380 [Steroidobacteraceae bacterium]
MQTQTASFTRAAVICALILLDMGAAGASAREISPGITVEAQRKSEELKNDVNAFLAAALLNPLRNESLMRWDHPMCPLVAGLTREEGEFVLHRLSDIARTVRAPLGKEDCNPNLLVIVARNPSVFLKLLWNRKPLMFDTHYGIAPVKHFIETSRPIRVWYDAYIIPSDHGVPFSSMFSSLLAESEAHGTTGIAYPVFEHPTFTGTRLAFPVVRDFAAAIVVVDPALVEKLDMGQLADYIGLVGLAQINLDRDLGHAPSILNVFHPSETAPPQALTTWDKALLFALYNTQQGSPMQLSNMQTAALNYIVSQLAH